MLAAPRSLAICLVLVCFASVVFADDFKTIDGKEYKNATVSRIEPDGLVLTTKSGVLKVYFSELPGEVQQRFHYNAQQAAQFTAATQNTISEQNAQIAEQQEAATAEQRRKAEIQRQAVEQQQQAIERQEQIAAQQQQRQLKAQQKQVAKIAAQTKARQQHQRTRGIDAHRRAIEEDIRGHREAQRENLRYQINAIEADRSVRPLSNEEKQTLRTLERERDSIPH